MSDTLDPEERKLFGAFKDVQADPQRSAQAIERARQSLVQGTVEKSPDQSSGRANMRRNILAATSIVALVVICLAAATLLTPEAAIGFSQVREQLEKVRTVSVSVKVELEGMPTESSRVLIRDDGWTREEYSDGRYAVFQKTKEFWRRLEVDPFAKTAIVVNGFPQELPLDDFDVLSSIGNLPEKLDAQPVDERTFAGQNCPGFRFEVKAGNLAKQESHLWVDPEKRLPVHYEAYLKPDESSTKGARKKGKATCSNFEYNVDFDDTLFSLTPPEGYKVTTHGSPPEKRSDVWSPDKLTMTVGQGIGPVKFGMSREQVISLLGEPEVKKDPMKHERKGRPSWETEVWYYNSQGLIVSFSSLPEPGGLSSVSGRQGSYSSREFKGQTAKGIKIGSTPEEVRAAYGDPPESQPIKDGLGSYRYPKKGLMVGFAKDVVFQLQISRPWK